MKPFLITVLAIGISSPFLAQSAEGQSRTYPPEFAGSTSEVYKRVDETELNLWIFNPETEESGLKRSAIVFFFGGGWRGGTPKQFEQQCRYLAKQGMVAITADYRVLGRNKTFADRAVADAKSAIRYVRQNAKRLGIDPERIVAAGGSAGGHLAACTELINELDEPTEKLEISSRPNALALFNPALVIAPWDGLPSNPETMAKIATITGVTPQEISPIHHLRKEVVPTIIFHGKADTTVPYVTVEKYAEEAQRLDNQCELIGYADNSHGFFNYGRGGTPGSAYLLTVHSLHRFLYQQGYLASAPEGLLPSSPNVQLRDPMLQAKEAITQRKKATVAFIGGSITEMNGYRPMVCDWLQTTYPETEFNFVNSGISSTCSTTGAFRFERDVLSTKPDLVLIEFAVNDDQDAGHSRDACIRGMEGIIRHAKQSYPDTDLLVTYFVNPSMLEIWQSGQIPLSVSAHDQVMRHYGISTVGLAKEVADRISSKQLTWNQFGGTHPAPTGNRIAADLVQDLLQTAWNLPEATGIDAAEFTQPSLPKMIDPFSYAQGRLVPVSDADSDSNWQLGTPQWKSIKGSMRSRFESLQFISSEVVDSELHLRFGGSAIGIFVLAGPDAGRVEFKIDDGPIQTKDLYHRHSKGLHYPRTVMLDDELNPGEHLLTLRVGDPSDREGSGSAIRILAFTTNEKK